MSVRRKSALLLGVMVAFTAAVCALLVVAFRDASKAADWVTHTSDVRAAAFELRGHILAAQLEQRTELLRDGNHGAAFERRAAEVDADVSRLRELVRDNPEQRAALDGVEASKNALFANLRASIASRTPEPDTDALSSEIERRLDAVISQEDQLMTERERRSSAKDLDALLELVVASLLLGTVATIAVQQRHAVRLAEAAFEQERAANRMKDEFLATISHELRTPLTAILGWSKMLATLPPAEAAKGVTTIERNATALARIVDDVLDVSRIVTGKLGIARERLDLADVMAAAIRVVEPTAVAKGVTIELRAEPCPFWGDVGRLQQIFWNLLSNAVKFTSEGGKVTCEVRHDGPTAIVVVRDTGRGIARDFLPHVFERFRQHDSSSTRAFGGLGLGLAIVRYLVELHGGTVRAQSAGLGQGATFVVEMPIRAVAQEAPAPEEADATQRPLDGVSVLVCDDEDDARDLVCAVLEHAGARVEMASNAQAALEAVREHHPNVLVSDIGMPIEDGYSLVRRLRALPAGDGRETPAVALTAYASPADVQRALAAGFQKHVAKPVDPDALVSTLAALTHARALINAPRADASSRPRGIARAPRRDRRSARASSSAPTSSRTRPSDRSARPAPSG